MAAIVAKNWVENIKARLVKLLRKDVQSVRYEPVSLGGLTSLALRNKVYIPTMFLFDYKVTYKLIRY